MRKILKPFAIALFLSWQVSILNAQTTVTYSILSTAYNRSTSTFYPLGSVDGYWFLTKIQNMTVPLNPATIVNYPNSPTYVVTNSGNNTFTGIISNRSINSNNSTTSLGLKVITYRTFFNLPNSTNKSYSLNFKMSADDAVDNVKLNGVEKGHFLDASFNNIPGVNKPYMLTIAGCDTSFRPGQNYIDVTIADAGGSVGFYAEITLSEISTTCPTQVGIKEYNNIPLFTVSPNPTNTNLIINLNPQFTSDISKTIVFEIYSIDGKLLRTEKINKDELNQHIIKTSDLNDGIYFLTIISGNYSQNLKFVKE